MKRYSMRHSFVVFAVMFCFSLLIGTYVYAQRPKTVYVTIDAKQLTLYTNRTTLKEALEEANVYVEDMQGTVSLDSAVVDEMHVDLQTAKKVALRVGTEEKEIKTYAVTVSDLLQEQQVELAENDEIMPARAALLESGMHVSIDHVEWKEQTKQEAIPFEETVKQSEELYVDESEEVQAGEEGIREITTRTKWVNGVAQETETLKNVIVKQPVTRIVEEGTKEYPKSTGSKSSAPAPTSGTTLMMEATAYTHTGERTATGAWPQAYFTVATDPSVIPMGTRLYIEGYGYGVAQDTGGAIQGNIIDVFFDTESECVNWGRRMVQVTILD